MPNALGLEQAAIAQQRIEDAGEATGEGDRYIGVMGGVEDHILAEDSGQSMLVLPRRSHCLIARRGYGEDARGGGPWAARHGAGRTHLTRWVVGLAPGC